MIRSTTILTFIAALLVIVGITTGRSEARVRSVTHGGTYVGSVVVEHGQIVDGNLTVIAGDATVEGQVNGDVNVVGGTLQLLNGGAISGETHQVGGEVADAIVPWASSGDIVRAEDSRVWWRIAWDVVVLLVFLIFPLRTRMALDRLEHHPGLATAVGLFGWVAVIPLAILLAITLVLIPLIFVEFVLLTAGVFLGTAALALLVGRRFYELLQPNSTPSPFVALVLGLTLLTAGQIVPVVGVLVTLLTALVGLGAAILTFIPSAPSAGPGVAPGRSIGGPPMPVG